MPQPVDFRLPGVYFLPQPPAGNLPLPRLDVAAFVGFAERGPLDLPVPLEDFQAYEQVFGGDFPLAQETAPPTGVPLSSPQETGPGSTPQGVAYAALPTAVRAFFANGGRRCWVVRVAGERAEAARFRLPGVVALRGENPVTSFKAPRLAGVSASSPGRWGNRLRLASRLSVTPLPVDLFYEGGSLSTRSDSPPGLAWRVNPRLLRPGVTALVQTGDVLRLTLEDGKRLLAVIDTIETPAQGQPFPLLRMAHVYLMQNQINSQPLRRVERLTVEGFNHVNAEGEAERVNGGRTKLILRLPPRSDHVVSMGAASISEPKESRLLTELEYLRQVADLAGSTPLDLTRGDIVRLTLDDGETQYLARLEGLRTIPPEQSGEGLASPVEDGGVIEAFLSDLLSVEEINQLPLLGTSPDTTPSVVAAELLRLDILVRLDERRFPAITGLAFNRGAGARHPRFWGDAIWLGSAFSGGIHPLSSSVTSRNVIRTGTIPEAAAALFFRRLFADPYHLRPAPGEVPAGETILPEEPRFWNPARAGFSPLTALAGLLAPAGSGLSLSYAAATESPLEAGGEAELDQVYLPIGLPEIFTEADPGQFLLPESGREGADDLQTFQPYVFYDPRLAPQGVPGSSEIGETTATLVGTASALRYIEGRRLRGMHSLLFVEEAALISVPDAAQRPWEPAATEPEPPPPKPAPPARPADCEPESDFEACDRPPSLEKVTPHWGPMDAETPVEVHGQAFTTSEETRLFFGTRPASHIWVHSSTLLTALAPKGVRMGPVEVSVETGFGRGAFPGGFIYTAPTQQNSRLPRVVPPAISELPDEAPLLDVHQALSILCQARGDLVGVISLPKNYDRKSCLEWQAALRSRLRLPALEAGSGPAAVFGRGLDEPVEAGDLSYLAVYHPWLRVFDPRGPGRLIPPDGAVCGLIAARERERAAWIAPANRPLVGTLGLGTFFSEDDWSLLFERGFNLVRPEANGFAPMSAHTLSADRSLLQVSVRRLLILLKKAAVNLGMDFAFENNHAVFREGVRVILEELLGDLYERGAFAGNSRATAFRVITGEEVNPPESVDAGRFIALIQVAPSQPMEFITVQLIRLNEGGLAAGET